jgi:DNA-directed RNA polymerase specialized sigma24 family protein
MLTRLAALPERDRTVIELVDIAGLRPKEAAAVLGLTPGTVRMRLMRTRARLRQQGARGSPASAEPAAKPHTATGSTIHEPDRGDRND